MIVSFSVSNFRSFSVEETFSLVASKRIAGTHETHAVPIPDSAERVLKAAVIYGANGAGKSNLFKALRFLKSTALESKKKGDGTGRQAFKSAASNPEVSGFDLQFIAAGTLYRYGFKLDDVRITEEWLLQVHGGREKILYERVVQDDGAVDITAPGLKEKKLKALATVGGPQNQTFLATVYATLDEAEFGGELSGVFSWLQNDLRLIAPSETYRLLAHKLSKDAEFLEFAGEYLKASSTGVDRLDVQKTEISEDELSRLVPKEISAAILDDLKAGKKRILQLQHGRELLLEKTDENHWYQISIDAMHRQNDGQAVRFALADESDGTRRLLNLLPALHHLRTSSAVYFIDEIDRSMHPLLVLKFLEFFLKSCESGQGQIIVTTHESNLLDLDLFRRDEIWFAEKDANGSTRLYSLSDFNVRKDLEIQKHYLQGRFGAVPFLGGIDRLLEQKDCAQ